MNTRTRPLVLSLTLAAVLLATTACIPLPSPLGPDGAAGLPTSVPDDAQTPAPGESTSVAPDDVSDVFAEREEYFREQQLPMDGSPLVAVTPAQKEFIAEQRAYVEQQGSTWTSTDENLALALAGDACETAILNRHRVDATTLNTHVATSPLFAQLIPSDLQGAARTQAEKPIASVMVFGATFMCPADGDAWVAAYKEVYGG
ncbi:hypothetical protein DEU35_2685 [Microbacterium sp. AG157]|uniref:Lipoprotein n=1 Tax=Microbacterium testaceum TaxID=2033 RepID=A0A4Y3QKZ8_MICTE|nr:MULTISPECIES: hypothetical protein [Microbacterium]REC96935.1 hypothetical protein DEU35_2685 [Microbacterium sp. AG157]WJS92421.1 hypothetical protein NYQ11_07705 [Microbacterium testaceum]GEB45629.1 hypothetical protein MTE01_15740 [Microbacterium testaceum]